MRKIILFSAVSIDGFIAKRDGNIDWLFNFDKANQRRQKESQKIFLDFYKTIDTTFIGNNTYKHMVKNGNQTPFGDKENFVFTKSKSKDSRNATYVNENLIEFIETQKKIIKQDIWLVGGGILNSFFLQKTLIDIIILDIIPIVLGNGIKLFENCSEIMPKRFYLNKTKKSSSGCIQLNFSRKNDT